MREGKTSIATSAQLLLSNAVKNSPLSNEESNWIFPDGYQEDLQWKCVFGFSAGSFASMFRVVYKQNSRDRTLIMQLQFNQRVTRVKTRNMSAVKWVALVTCVFLLCYGILMRCSFFVLTGHKCTDDLHYKLPVQGINSGLNPIAYAMFKRDIKQECKRYLFKRSRCLTTEQLLC